MVSAPTPSPEDLAARQQRELEALLRESLELSEYDESDAAQRAVTSEQNVGLQANEAELKSTETELKSTEAQLQPRVNMAEELLGFVGTSEGQSAQVVAVPAGAVVITSPGTTSVLSAPGGMTVQMAPNSRAIIPAPGGGEIAISAGPMGMFLRQFMDGTIIALASSRQQPISAYPDASGVTLEHVTPEEVFKGNVQIEAFMHRLTGEGIRVAGSELDKAQQRNPELHFKVQDKDGKIIADKVKAKKTMSRATFKALGKAYFAHVQSMKLKAKAEKEAKKAKTESPPLQQNHALETLKLEEEARNEDTKKGFFRRLGELLFRPFGFFTSRSSEATEKRAEELRTEQKVAGEKRFRTEAQHAQDVKAKAIKKQQEQTRIEHEGG